MRRKQHVVSRDEELFQHIMAGGSIPELDVRPRDEGGVWIVDGHRRYIQYGRALAAGAPLRDKKDGQAWIRIRQFEGNDVKRNYHIVKSNKKQDVSDFQLCYVYCRARDFGETVEQIADGVKKSVKHVREILSLADSNHDVQNAIKAGDISRTTAIAVIKEHGEKAGAVIEVEVKKAKAQGRKRATPGTMRAWRPTPRLATPMITAAERLVDAIDLSDRMRIENGCTDDHTMISVPASALAALLKPHEDIAKARQEAAQRVRERTLETSQGDMVKEAA